VSVSKLDDEFAKSFRVSLSKVIEAMFGKDEPWYYSILRLPTICLAESKPHTSDQQSTRKGDLEGNKSTADNLGDKLVLAYSRFNTAYSFPHLVDANNLDEKISNDEFLNRCYQLFLYLLKQESRSGISAESVVLSGGMQAQYERWYCGNYRRHFYICGMTNAKLQQYLVQRTKEKGLDAHSEEVQRLHDSNMVDTIGKND
jgi:hypothetical protein